MKTKASILLLAVVLYGCVPADDLGLAGTSTYTLTESEAPASATESQTSLWATNLPQDANHLFIRQAELKFEVQNVARSTYAIENLTRNFGGFVEQSELQSSEEQQTTVIASNDSILKTTRYRTSCVLTLRVPASDLDTLLHQVVKLSTFIDYRKVTTQNIILDILSLELDRDRFKKYEPFTVQQAQKDSSTDALFRRAQEADQAKVAQMRLTDKVQYSTIMLTIYQPENIRYQMTPNQEHIKAYEPHFGQKVWESLESGWTALEFVILLLLKLWGLWLIGGVVLFLMLYIRRKNKNNQ